MTVTENIEINEDGGFFAWLEGQPEVIKNAPRDKQVDIYCDMDGGAMMPLAEALEAHGLA